MIIVLISWTAAASMTVTALAMVLTPGPNMIYLVSRSVSQGRVAGLISLLGTITGFIGYMTLANAGLAVVFIAVPWLFIGFKAAGVGYLTFLAWRVLRPGGRGMFEASEPLRDSDRDSDRDSNRDANRDANGKLFRMGLLTNLLNPKAAIMYLALIPQFIDPSKGHTTAQGFLLGGIQISVSAAVNAVIVIAAGAVATLIATRPAWVRWQRWITGTMLGAVALLLAREVPHRAALSAP